MTDSRRHSSEAPESESGNAIAMWDFRMNLGELTADDIRADLKKIAKQYVFQFEEGDSGYRHIQGRLSLIKKRRVAQKHLVLNLLVNKFNYFQPTANATFYKGDMFYCMKEDTRIAGPYTDRDKEAEEKYIPRQYRGLEKTLLPWQKKLIEYLGNFEPRKINVIYDGVGNNGKSTCAHLCRLHHNCLTPPTINDYEKLVATICCILKDTNNRNPAAMFFDMPRAMGKERLYGFYSAIEQIKSGYVYDMRNHYKSWDFDSPQIWIFTNKEPEMELQSRDRWVCWEIKDGDLLPYNFCKIDLKNDDENVEYVECDDDNI